MFGFRLSEYDYSNTLNHWRALEEKVGGADPWIKVMKYKLAAFYSAAQDQTIPKAPFADIDDKPNYLLGGKWCRWFRLFCKNSCEMCRQSFLTGLLFGVKKGCPRASADGLHQAKKETYKKLTTSPLERPPIDPEFVDLDDYISLSRDSIQTELIRTVREVFQKTRITVDDLFKLPFPSTSANYYSSRSKGGAVASIFEAMQKLDFSYPKECVVLEVGGVWDEESGEFSPTCVYRNGGREEMRNTEIDLYRQLLEMAKEERPLVETVALPESLKIRVITKGPALTGYVLKSFQTFVHGNLKRHSTFQLIGTPVTEGILDKIIGRLKPGEKFLSGDYKDATDGMNWWVSSTIAREIVNVLFQDWGDCQFVQEFSDLYVRSLIYHEIEDPDHPGEYGLQLNGQLMGSISSFPVLCLANAALCRWAMEKGEKKFLLLKKARLLINGDDCLFPANELTHRLWLSICPWYGMLPSVGKYYYSCNFCNINSTTYLYTPGSSRMELYPNTLILHWVERPFTLVKFVNFGILLNVKRSGTSMGPENIFDEYFTFSSNSYELIETFPEGLVDLCHRQYHRDFGRFATSNKIKIPWYVPKHFGGVGLAPYGDRGPSSLDRAACHYFYANKTRFQTIGKDMTWTVHKNVQAFLPIKGHSEDKSSYDNWYGHAVKTLFLRSCFDNNFDMLYKEPRNEYIRALRSAESAWQRVLKQKLSNYSFEIPQSDPKFYPNILPELESSCV